MSKTTEKEEFLETLKNPTKAHLIQAVAEFQEARRSEIYSAIVYEDYKDGYTIEITSYNHVSWCDPEEELIKLIKKYLKNPMINIRIHPNRVDELFVRSYFVTEI